MKFLSLLYGDTVSIAPGKKVIPAAEFSKLCEAEELIAQIHEEHKKFQEEAQKRAEEEKELARKEGFQKGLDEWAKQLANFEKALEKEKKELDKLITPVAIKAAQKVVAYELEVKPETLVNIIKQSMKAVAQHHRFTIYVSKHDYTLIEENRPALREGLEAIESLAVQMRDDVKPGDAIIETEAGIINVQMEQVWKSLETAFQALMRK